METSTPILAKLRLKLAETYDESAGETESDTLFTDEQLKIVLRESATLNAAILDGWETKMAHWAELVSVTDGAAARNLSDLYDHALNMVNLYTKKVSAGPSGSLARTRTRVGSIRHAQG